MSQEVLGGLGDGLAKRLELLGAGDGFDPQLLGHVDGRLSFLRYAGERLTQPHFSSSAGREKLSGPLASDPETLYDTL